MARIAAVALLAVLAGGCSGPAVAPTDAAVDTSTVDLDAARQWLRDYHIAACGSLANCPQGEFQAMGNAGVAFLLAPDACATSHFIQDDHTRADLADGVLAFDATAASACLADLRNGACGSVLVR